MPYAFAAVDLNLHLLWPKKLHVPLGKWKWFSIEMRVQESHADRKTMSKSELENKFVSYGILKLPLAALQSQ